MGLKVPFNRGVFTMLHYWRKRRDAKGDKKIPWELIVRWGHNIIFIFIGVILTLIAVVSSNALYQSMLWLWVKYVLGES